MSLKTKIGIILPCVIVLILIIISVTNITVEKTKTTIESITFNDLFYAQEPIVIQQIDAYNNFIVPVNIIDYNEEIIACVVDEEKDKAMYFSYCEVSTNNEVIDEGGLSIYSDYNTIYSDYNSAANKEVPAFSHIQFTVTCNKMRSSHLRAIEIELAIENNNTLEEYGQYDRLIILTGEDLSSSSCTHKFGQEQNIEVIANISIIP